jgi:hypothetical protein
MLRVDTDGRPTSLKSVSANLHLQSDPMIFIDNRDRMRHCRKTESRNNLNEPRRRIWHTRVDRNIDKSVSHRESNEDVEA